ncbi:MAG TPA: monooxygenase, partial [Polyangiaceae bacterium]|nr:monooxygenase [Polyangiaceae bacterium]
MLSGCTDDPIPTGAVTPAPEPAESYYKDIKPIVDMKCSGCHQAGGVGPFPLTTYEEVSAMKDVSLLSVESRSMPPWP